MARAVATSAAFDLLTLAQVRRLDAARVVSRGWIEGLRAIRSERGARRPDGASARGAPAGEPPRGDGAAATPWTRMSDGLTCPAPARQRCLPRRRSEAGDRLHGIPGEFDVHVCRGVRQLDAQRRSVPTERLGELYPPGVQRIRAAGGTGPARSAATGLFRWRYRRGPRRPPLGELRGSRPGGCSTSAAAAAISASARSARLGRDRARAVAGRLRGGTVARRADRARGRSPPRAARSAKGTTRSSSSTRWSTSPSRSTTCAPPRELLAPGRPRRSSRCRTSGPGTRAASVPTGSTSTCRAIARTSRARGLEALLSAAPGSRPTADLPRRRAPTASR